MDLIQLLHQQLQAAPMPFVDFMQQVLYTPQVGYYSSTAPKLGASGDFTTAPELTPLFGYTLAQQCQQVLMHCPHPQLFEFGAGTGQLCIDILSYLEQQQALPTIYFILEVSESLRQLQQQRIMAKIPHLASRVKWLSAWPDTSFCGVILANEVLDAMPVHRFLQTTDGLLEEYITLDAQNQWVSMYQPVFEGRLKTYVDTNLGPYIQPVPSTGYLSEVNLFIESWLQQCSQMLEQGAFFIIDYGFPRHEYYHADRHQGTLMCHYRHQAHPNPLCNIGEQDITAHVDFTHVAEAACQAGFHVAGYTNQASFLLANGLLSLVASLQDELRQSNQEAARLRLQQAVRQLIQPEEMGELFKVIALTKQINFPLQGFQMQDKRGSL